MFRSLIASLAVLALSVSTASAQPSNETSPESPKTLSARDTLRINSVSDPRISPDGQWVVYTKRVRDLEDEELKATSHLWRVRADGSDRRQITYGEDSCTDPRWFPDGRRLAFLSERGQKKKAGEGGDGPKSQVFLMHLDGGEAWQATKHEEGVNQFEISPDGSRLLFLSRDPLPKEKKERKKKKDDAEVVDEEFRFSHLWVFEVQSGQAKRLTQGEFTVVDAQWSPGSDRIAYVTRPNTNLNEGWNSDVWVIGLEGKEPRRLHENPGRDSSPRWSPDGSRIAFLSEPTPGTNTWHNQLLATSAEGGPARRLAAGLDRNPQAPIWSTDGSEIFFPAGDGATWNLFAVDVESERVRRLEAPPGGNFGWDLSKDGSQWVWVHSGPSRPGEIYAARADLTQAQALSDANSWLREEGYQLARLELIQWKNSDGQTIEGVLTWPVGRENVQRHPLILNPHGGPSGAVTLSFDAANQFLAGNGFLILEPNFRGSSNYGQVFLNANRGNWGVRDYDDCMTGVDAVIERGWADPERMVCYGWSYGGYMSFWISTQTNRFKAISPGAGLSNLYSMYSTTDISHYLGWFFSDPGDETAFLGTPWDSEEVYERLSPIRHVKKVTSPMLILHGAQDRRVPPEQAVEFYRALRDLGKEVTFVIYPREGHGLREPRHQIDRLKRYLTFFSKHVGLTPTSEPEEAPEAPPEETNPR